MDFIESLLTKPETPKNRLDLAIEEDARGDVYYYDTVDEMMANLENE